MSTAIDDILTELIDRYDGAPDSPTRWMGSHIQALEAAAAALEADKARLDWIQEHWRDCGFIVTGEFSADRLREDIDEARTAMNTKNLLPETRQDV